MLSWQTSTAVQLSNPSAVDCVHVAFLCKAKQSRAKQSREEAEAEITPRSSIVGCFLRLSTPSRAIASSHVLLEAPRGCCFNQQIVVLASTMEHKGINDKPHQMQNCPSTEHIHWVRVLYLRYRLLASSRTDHYLHPRIYSSHA